MKIQIHLSMLTNILVRNAPTRLLALFALQHKLVVHVLKFQEIKSLAALVEMLLRLRLENFALQALVVIWSGTDLQIMVSNMDLMLTPEAEL